jgi:predicted transcriptional regulator
MEIDEIARALGLSRQRVDQILRGALEKAGRRLRAAGYELGDVLDRHPQRRGTDPGLK